MSNDRDIELKRHFRWRCLFGVFMLLGVGFLAWLFWPAGRLLHAEVESDVSSRGAVAPTSVEAISVARSDLSLLAQATGTLKASRQVEVGLEIGGRVAWMKMKEGQRVQAGDLILRLDDEQNRLELAEAEAELLRVRAGFAVAFATQSLADDREHERRDEPLVEADYREAKRLFAEGLMAEKEWQRIRRRVETARLLDGAQRDDVQAATAGLTQAELRVERARLALASTRLLAPFAGRIADIEVEVGQQVSALTPCFSLLDDSRLKVDVAVLEADIIRLRPDAPATVQVPALGERIFGGRVHTINPRVDRETGTGRVTVILENPDGLLLPGLFAYVSLETGVLRDRLQVPVEAILERQGRQLVFRLERGRALWTYVETGARSADSVEIISGLAEGDVVAVGNHFALAHEAPVEVLDATEGV